MSAPARTKAKGPTGRRARAEEARRRKRAQQRLRLLLIAAAGVVAVLVGLSVSGGGGGGSKSASTTTTASRDIDGLRVFHDLSRNHVAEPVSYPQSPPVGGNHNPLPQTCGFYAKPITNENAVHSLEHGAVWLTYRPGLSESDVAQLEALGSQPYTLVSPYPGQRAPVIATAWERQVDLTGVDDPRLERFVNQFRAGAQAPERGSACAGTNATAG